MAGSPLLDVVFFIRPPQIIRVVPCRADCFNNPGRTSPPSCPHFSSRPSVSCKKTRPTLPRTPSTRRSSYRTTHRVHTLLRCSYAVAVNALFFPTSAGSSSPRFCACSSKGGYEISIVNSKAFRTCKCVRSSRRLASRALFDGWLPRDDPPIFGPFFLYPFLHWTYLVFIAGPQTADFSLDIHFQIRRTSLCALELHLGD